MPDERKCPLCGELGKYHQDCYYSLLAELERERDVLAVEVERLNQMLRQTGYGQGQIDAYTRLRKRVEHLEAALADCMTYVDCDNLTQQTKHRRWQAVLDGEPWNPSNCEVTRY